MTEGIIARFRTMAIFRPSVLTGHVAGSLLQTMLSLAVVTGVALGIGFRPSASPLEWLAAAGVLALITFALTWLCVAFGLVAKTVEAASNLPQPLVFLPFWAAASSPPTRCRPGCAGSPSTSRSRP
jgi:ABC-2 type transport system permease protein